MTASTINRIDQKLENIDAGSLRARVLLAVRQFRSSWIELGRLLTQVAYGGDYKEWGYDDLELYCARELGLKKPTVQKLMVSYNYMKQHEPRRLEAYEEAPSPREQPTLPDYQTVELLHRARQREELDEEAADDLHQRAFAGEEDENILRKEIRDRMRSTRDGVPWDEEGYSRDRELTDLLRAARAFRRRLATVNAVPDELRERLEQALVELEALE